MLLARPASRALSPALPGLIRPSAKLFSLGPFLPRIRNICVFYLSVEVKLDLRRSRRRVVVLKRCQGKFDASPLARLRAFNVHSCGSRSSWGEVLLASVNWFRTVTPSRESLLLLVQPLTFVFRAYTSAELCLLFGNSCFCGTVSSRGATFTHVHTASVDVFSTLRGCAESPSTQHCHPSQPNWYVWSHVAGMLTCPVAMEVEPRARNSRLRLSRVLALSAGPLPPAGPGTSLGFWPL